MALSQYPDGMKTDKPTRAPQTADKFILRLPDGLRNQIADLAKANNRSMNAELIARVQETLQPDRCSIASMGWLELVEMIEAEATKRGMSISLVINPKPKV